MLTYSKVAAKPSLLQNFTGLSTQAFAKLLKSFEKAYEAARDEQDAATLRQRQRGGGRKPVLATAADKLLFILFYYKFYPTQEVQGFFFGFGKAQANAWIRRLTPVVNQALGYELQLPARQPADVEAVLAACPGLEFIIDGKDLFSGPRIRKSSGATIVVRKSATWSRISSSATRTPKRSRP